MAVKKAIDTGRIRPLPDGTIDPVAADAQWAANTTPKGRSVAIEVKEAPQVSAQLAAGLNADPHAVHVALDAAVRQQLQDLGDLQPKVD